MRNCIAMAVLGAFVFAGAASAQDRQAPPQNRDFGSPSQSDRGGVDSKLEDHVASCLLLANKQQVAISEYAEDRAEDSKVKEFAKKMAEKHEECESKLQRFAPQAASVQLDGGSRDDSVRQASTASGFDDQSLTGELSDELFKLERRAAEECLSLTKKQMDELDGKDLDKAYIGQQIGAHTAMLAKLSASENAASGDLKQLIKEGKDETKDHLEKAKKIMKDLHGES